jgi:hypothetical protein
LTSLEATTAEPPERVKEVAPLVGARDRTTSVARNVARLTGSMKDRRSSPVFMSMEKAVMCAGRASAVNTATCSALLDTMLLNAFPLMSFPARESTRFPVCGFRRSV